MFWVLVVFAVVVSIVVFSLIGFFQVLAWIFGSGSEEKSYRTQPERPKLSSDVKASQRILDHLYSKNQIRQSTYLQLREFLQKTFPANAEAAPARQSKLSSAALVSVQAPPKIEAISPSVNETTDPDRPSHPTQSSEVNKQETVVVAQSVVPPVEPVEQIESGAIGDLLRPATQLEAPVATVVGAKPAPWDIPDPPKPEPLIPRRSFGELMSGFMQEKNMRWGELTSGILIVLSAVGLVVSLREELRNTIPYFSALLFMLITAAIHGAGIYTLKKWKLRNTSRGTLVIGLLLVPLNFVAASVLSERRELHEPWLWIAIVVGLSTFSLMTWKSTKHLLRKGNLPMTLAMMGCGVGTLILNRTVSSASSSFHYVIFAFPVLASFLVGTCAFDPSQWRRRRWSQRASNRAFLFLGISAFAAIAALSLVVVRADSKLVGLVSVTPILSVICIVVSWIGSIVSRGAETTKFRTSELANEDKPIRVGGLALKVLGLVLLATSLAASATHPTIFVFNAILSGVGLIVSFIHQRDERLLPVAWSVIAFGLFAAINLVTGIFEFDRWTSLIQVQSALVSGKSGLGLLGIGLLVPLANSVLQRSVSRLRNDQAVHLSGWITGSSIFLAGCCVALLASLLHRENQFDVMTASGLLVLATIGSFVVCVVAERKKVAAPLSLLFHFAALISYGTLVHCFIWNPNIAHWVAHLIELPHTSWIITFAVHSLMLVGLGVALTARRTRALSMAIQGNSKDVAESDSPPVCLFAGEAFANWATVSTLAMMVGGLSLIQYHSGWATFFIGLAALNWLLIGWAWTRNESEWKELSAAPFVLTTGILISVALADLSTSSAWIPPINSTEHWLLHVCSLSVWSILWSVIISFVARQPRLKWVATCNLKMDQFVLFLLVVAIGGFVCDALLAGSVSELTNGQHNFGKFGLGELTTWTCGTLSFIATAIVVSLIFKPNAAKGFALVCVWMLAWGSGAIFFEDSKSVASALRWLLPIGGLVGATIVSLRRPLVPVWSAMRNGLGLSGRSTWRRPSTQQMINVALGMVAISVLLISTFTVAQVLLNGADSLGGPTAASWFKQIPAEISFGIPIAIIVATFLLYAVSEQRSWLATVGSAVFQYVVVLAVVLLFLSPHPKLASSWFVNILKAVSLGMSGYGFIWFYFRDRIEARSRKGLPAEAIKPDFPMSEAVVGTSQISLTASQQNENWFRRLGQIQIHTLLNGLLITSLAVLAMGRFFFVPDQPGSWISTVGSPLGAAAWAAFGALAFFVWRPDLVRNQLQGTWVWLIGWMGLILVGLAAAVVDQRFSAPEVFVEWLPFRVVMIGMLCVLLIQTGLIIWRERTANSSVETHNRTSTTLPLLLIGAIVLTFAVRGAWLDPNSFGLYLGVVFLLAVVATVVGWLQLEGKLAFVSTAIALIGVTVLVWKDPNNLIQDNQPAWLHLATIASAIVAAAWTGYFLFLKHKFSRHATEGNDSRVSGVKFAAQSPLINADLPGDDLDESWLPKSFLWQPNVVLILGSVWVLVVSLLQFGVGGWMSNFTFFQNKLGVTAIVAMVGLSGLSLWNDRATFRVFSWCALSLAIGIALPSTTIEVGSLRFVAVTLAISLVIALWGIAWLNRAKIFSFARRAGATRLSKLEESLGHQLPIYSLLLAALAMLAATMLIFNSNERVERYLAAMVPFAAAIGIGTQSNQSARRWLQILTLALSTSGVLFLAWADLSQMQMAASPKVRLFVRSLIVLSGAMFVYGGLVTRWVREGDTWLKSLREMAVVTCVLAIGCLVMVLAGEATAFQRGFDHGLSFGESIAVAVLVASMVVGLIVIAIRPEKDPFALSVNGRMGYAYAAEFVSLAWIAHLYFTMPFLFQFGIEAYWPYILMAVCFGGVGLARVLEKRNLKVLGQPLFNTAVVLPLIVAFAIFTIDSKAQPELVMMIVGLAYLMISYTHKSLLSGAAAIVFGNLALWLVFNRADFSIFEHPQLWLIPPAGSVLVAGQLSKSRLSAGQLSALRYICMIVIYVSSTMEVFISGIGENLWPPIILATLSVAGIMCGMMFRVKSFLYFGSLFLLMAMITMVAHAHQSLNHVWPWWAFGIGLGIAILVMFGLFEKKKNEMQALAGSLREWEA